MIPLSAKTPAALEAMTRNLAGYFKKNPGINLADAAYTLKVGRRGFLYRRMWVCSTVDEAIEALSSADSAKHKTRQIQEEERPVIFMFSGLGSQYINMGAGLYREEPVFREEMDRCFRILKALMNADLKEILYPPSGGEESPAPSLHRIDIAQLVIFVFEYALAVLLIKWGITPFAMIGYSFGEYTAACISGVFSLEDALSLIVYRGTLIAEMPPGAMISVPLTAEEIIPFLNNQLSIAIDNGPSCIVSGSTDAIDELAKQMKAGKYLCMPLQTDRAIHSRSMEPVLQKLEEKVSQITLNNPRIPFISNVTGTWISDGEAVDPGYWARHLRNTVKFAEGIKELLKKSNPAIVEIGPGHDLSVLCRHHMDDESKQVIINLVKHPQDKTPDERYLLNKLGRLWLEGVKIDWPEYYTGENRKRLPLPTYPFERLSYRIEGDPLKMAKGTETKGSPEKKPGITDWFYIPTWKRSPLTVPSGHKFSKKSRWLMFMDETGLGARLSERLKDEGQEIITVRAGERFARVSSGTFTVNPGQKEDYNSLLKELGTAAHRILHLWSVTGSGSSGNTGPEPGDIDEIQTSGFYSLMALAQAIGKQNYKERIQIAVISDGMQKVTGQEVISPAKATLLGAVKVIPLEYYNIDCSSIDIYSSETESPQYENETNQLLVEFLKDIPGPAVAYRNNFRWLQTTEPVQLEKPKDIPSRLRREGVYLITGGLGGIGYTIAEYLAKSVRAKLILTGRSLLPPREEWEQWPASHDPEDKTSRKIKNVTALEDLGSEVLVCSADVSHYRQMQDVITRAEKQFGPVNGVIHAAGLPDGGVIPLRTRQSTDKILAPKVKGTLVLDELFKHTALDFFIHCSSLVSILGVFGQIGYCAANAFQDAHAQYKFNAGGCFTASINWDTWREVGLGVDTLNRLVKNKEIHDSEAQSLLKHAIFPSEGIDIFSRVIEYSLPQVITSTRNLPDIMALNRIPEVQAEPAAQESEAAAKPGKLYPRPDLGTEYIVPNTGFEITCAGILQQYFGFEKVGIHDNLFDFGVTSLEMIHINEKLNKELKTDIPLVIMFEFPTIHSLQEYLDREETTGSLEPEYDLQESANLLYDTVDLLGDTD
jgi:acyl transferase domain-containing protein